MVTPWKTLIVIAVTLVGCSYQTKGKFALGSFSLIELDSQMLPDGTLKTWRATSRDPEEPFEFRLELLLRTLKGEVVFSKGAISREGRQDGRSFLKDIAVSTDAVVDLFAYERANRIEFDTAILREPPEFSTAPSSRRDCKVIKLFLDEGAGEIYLTIDPIRCEGEFQSQDPEYATAALKELASVFLQDNNDHYRGEGGESGPFSKMHGMFGGTEH